MLDSGVIDVAIGLILVYVTLSFCVTAGLEAIAEPRQWRGRTLFSQLSRLLGPNLVDALYEDRRVVDLMTGVRLDKKRRFGWLNEWWYHRRPWQFSDVPLDKAFAIAGRQGARRLPSQIPDGVVADVLMDWLQGIGLPTRLQPGSKTEDCTPQEYELADLWDRMNRRADGDQLVIRAELSEWYRQSMVRLTGQYKRNTRLTMYLLGFVLVLATNADTLRIVDTLYREPALRQQLVAQAEALNAACQGDAHCDDLRQAAKAAFDPNKQEPVGQLLGWRSPPLGKEDPRTWLNMALGFLLTTLAIALGADFWLAALKRVVAVKQAQSDQAGTNSSAGGRTVPDTPSPLHAPPRTPLDAASPLVAGLAGFQPLRFAESTLHAYWLAQFAQMAYSEPAAVQASDFTRAHGLSWRFHSSGSTQAYVSTRPGICIVAFRGTEQKLDDWITDAKVRLDKGPWGTSPEVAIHTGFREALDSIWEPLLLQLREVKSPIWFTGHSLGGALAVLAAFRLSHKPAAPPSTIGGVYTFGQPRVANEHWATSCSEALMQRLFRYVNASDIVPHVPPPAQYCHIGEMRYFDTAGRLHHERTLWERLAEQAWPALQAISADPSRWAQEAAQYARKRVADHGMARYVERLERLDAVRALWAAPAQVANEVPTHAPTAPTLTV